MRPTGRRERRRLTLSPMREWFAPIETQGRLVPQTWEDWAALLAVVTAAIGGSVLIGVASRP